MIRALLLTAALAVAAPALAEGMRGPVEGQVSEPGPASAGIKVPPEPTQPTEPAEAAEPRRPPGTRPAEAPRPQRPRRLDLQVVRAGGPPVLVVQGPFTEGDADRFEQVLNTNPGIREVLFNSPGGSVDEGLNIGRHIRARRLATRVPGGAECASICTMAFLGGVLRRIDTGASYCVHMFASSDPDLANRVTGLIRERGVDATREVIEVMQGSAARIAASWARYLIEMQVSLRLMTPTFRTRHRDIYCLERDELRDYVVVNVN